jgi:SAM-dependent methyltransferase
MKNLKEISLKYDVDKLELGFLDHYEEKFKDIRNNVTKVLEIGVETGRSHRMWLEYFPNATIYGYDIFEYGVEEFHSLQKGNPNLNRSVTFKGDQSNISHLNNFLDLYGGDFDIIIDDGGHTMKQQQVSLKYLFDSVKPGGYYIIEDLHTCSGQWGSLYGYEVISKGDTLTTDLLDSLENNDTSIQETNYLSKEDINKIRNNIEYCNTKVGVSKYRNYNWPTLLSFMKLK